MYKFIFFGILSFLMVYLIHVFYFLAWNPVEFGESGRFSVMLIWIVWNFGYHIGDKMNLFKTD